VAEITGGETRGGNLFHSFQDFSVGTGNEAAFLNANDLANIFSRVTGGNISNIDGLISANGSANLFLINPAGIIFGENARLDVGGSFYGSSASSILFEDGEFSATDLDNPPLLTINAPIGLNFRDNPGDITNNSVANDGSGLEVATRNNLTLLGGNVSFDGGNITAPGGVVNLGGLTAVGTININDDGSLSFPEGIARGNVSLANSSEVSVLSDGGGSIFVNARNLNLTSGSNFAAGISEDLGSVNAQAGDIIIDATESVTLKEASPVSPSISLISNIVESGAVGNAGDINITTTNLALTNGSIISTTTFGEGNTGNIDINATELVTLDNINFRLQSASGIYIQQTDAVGNGGELNIVTSNLALKNGGRIDASTFGESNGGSIDINATESITIDGTSVDGEFVSFIANRVESGAVGNAGEINLTTPNLSLTKGGRIVASTVGEGNGGNININATESITLNGITSADGNFNSSIENRVDMGAVGNAGEINITTANLDLTNGGLISASTLGEGNGGSIDINATNSVTLDGSITGTTFRSAIENRVDLSENW
jgi:filamentous hemagglutinin family protein